MSHHMDFSALTTVVLDLKGPEDKAAAVCMNFEPTKADDQVPNSHFFYAKTELVVVVMDRGDPLSSVPLRTPLVTVMRDVVRLLRTGKAQAFFSALFASLSPTDDSLVALTDITLVWFPDVNAEWTFGGEPQLEKVVEVPAGLVVANSQDAPFTLATTALATLIRSTVVAASDKDWDRLTAVHNLVKYHLALVENPS